MRGRLLQPTIERGRSGTTPAHAGKTPRITFSFPAHGDHPRACGEDVVVVQAGVWKTGPPPRMRGRRHNVRHHPMPRGTTPAHAGKTSVGLTCAPFGGDHPPRMRGRLGGRPGGACRAGPPPTHAGKTPGVCSRRPLPGTTPHACGEDDPIAPTAAPMGDHPPRMRGRRLLTWSDVTPPTILDTTAPSARQEH